MKNPVSASKLILIAAFVLFGANISFAQEEDAPPPSRSISSVDFQTQRPKTQSNAFAGKPTAAKSAKRRKSIAALGSLKRQYKYVARAASTQRPKPKPKNNKVKPVYVNEKLGVTFWRLRPARSDEDDAPTFPVENGKRRENWTAERVDSTTNFKKGDRVRFTIESPRNGFIYIVSREFYSDGVKGTPFLLYPTLKTSSGDNSVTQGTVIEIPQKNDIYSYFEVEQKRDDYAGEELYVIVSPTKLSNVKIALSIVDLPEKTLNKWLDDWSGTVDIYDAEDGEGIAYTETESDAANVKTRALRLSEPSPQTIYSVRHLKNQPLLVPFQMNANPK